MQTIWKPTPSGMCLTQALPSKDLTYTGHKPVVPDNGVCCLYGRIAGSAYRRYNEALSKARAK